MEENEKLCRKVTRRILQQRKEDNAVIGYWSLVITKVTLGSCVSQRSSVQILTGHRPCLLCLPLPALSCGLSTWDAGQTGTRRCCSVRSAVTRPWWEISLAPCRQHFAHSNSTAPTGAFLKALLVPDKDSTLSAIFTNPCRLCGQDQPLQTVP